MNRGGGGAPCDPIVPHPTPLAAPVSYSHLQIGATCDPGDTPRHGANRRHLLRKNECWDCFI